LIAIYTPYHSNRTKYVLDYIFGQQFGCGYQLLNSPVRSDSATAHLNYSNTFLEGWLNISPSGFLDQTGIQQVEINFKKVNSLPLMFANDTDLGFDIFSAIFYCLSRYEEYQATELDQHNRFSYKQSILYQHNVLQIPLVDCWVNYLQSYLEVLYPGVCALKETNLKVKPTIDIDAVFTYKGKDFKRQLGGFMRDISHLKWTQLSKRVRVVLFGKKDPFDNFEYQLEILKKAGLKANYFVQVGKYGLYDKNINPENKAFQKVLRRLVEEGHSVGLHPSYDSFLNKKTIAIEKAMLENMIGQKVVKSRQHYLRFSLPQTYNDLIGLGIQEEFSMGYSEVPGFRASTSKPFYWYNLTLEESTSLEIVPFSAMDVAYKEFMKLMPMETVKSSYLIRHQIHDTKGCFCFVFHNESLSDYDTWKGWRIVFENWLKNEN
jgi:hypothetical protein